MIRSQNDILGRRRCRRRVGILIVVHHEIGPLQHDILEGIGIAALLAVEDNSYILARAEALRLDDTGHLVVVAEVDHALNGGKIRLGQGYRILDGLGSERSLIVDPAVCRQRPAAAIGDIAGSVIACVLDDLSRRREFIAVDWLEVRAPFTGLNIHALVVDSIAPCPQFEIILSDPRSRIGLENRHVQGNRQKQNITGIEHGSRRNRLGDDCAFGCFVVNRFGDNGQGVVLGGLPCLELFLGIADKIRDLDALAFGYDEGDGFAFLHRLSGSRSLGDDIAAVNLIGVDFLLVDIDLLVVGPGHGLVIILVYEVFYRHLSCRSRSLGGLDIQGGVAAEIGLRSVLHLIGDDRSRREGGVVFRGDLGLGELVFVLPFGQLFVGHRLDVRRERDCLIGIGSLGYREIDRGIRLDLGSRSGGLGDDHIVVILHAEDIACRDGCALNLVLFCP